jgi:hypothetical protein
MRGSVRKRGTTWTWYLFELAPVTGKRQQRSKGGFRTKRECQEALNEALARLREGTFVPPSQRTLGSFLLDEWLPAVRPPSVRPSTWLSYRMNAETHIVPALGHLPLQRLTPAQLTAFYRSLLDHGRRDGGGLAPKTVRNIHGELHTALKDAMRWGTSPATSPPRPTCQGHGARDARLEPRAAPGLPQPRTPGSALRRLAAVRHHWHAARGGRRPPMVRRGPGGRPRLPAPAPRRREL